MAPDYDVIVVGARIAGSITAALLGARGWRVLLLDRATFPSDTLSTHFFRSPALLAFERTGVFDQVEAIGAPHLTSNFNDVDGVVFSEPVKGTEGLDYYLCVRRITLDEILVRRAQREPTVEFRHGVSVRGLLREGDRIIGVRAACEGEADAVTARVVVGADGIHSIVARELQPRVEHAVPVSRAMYYAYFAGLEPQEDSAAEWHYRGNELVYVFGCDAGLTLLAVSVPIAEFPAWRRNGSRLFLERLRARPTLAPRLGRAERVGKLFGAGNIPCHIRVPYGPGWVLVGDAGLIMDPWSGQGIDQGSTHAVLVADGLHRWLSGEVSWKTAMDEFHAARNAFTEKAYTRTSTYATDLRPMTHAAIERRGFVIPH